MLFLEFILQFVIIYVILLLYRTNSQKQVHNLFFFRIER